MSYVIYIAFKLHLSLDIFLVSGDVPRVDGQLAVARAFGDKTIKDHLSSEPDVIVETIDDETEFMILASDGVWKVKNGQYNASHLPPDDSELLTNA